MDVVYILGTGSLANDDEIRYSLRTLEKHMQDMGDVYVIGENPPFLKNYKHIRFEDKYTERWKNMYFKVKAMCNLKDVTDEFLLMNDDFFATSNFKGAELPFYALKNASGGNCGKNSYAVHYPIRICKDMFTKMPLDPTAKGHFSPRTFYGNFYQAPPKFTNDCIARVIEKNGVKEVVRPDPDFFSIDDITMIDPYFINWLNERYPKRSEYES